MMAATTTLMMTVTAASMMAVAAMNQKTHVKQNNPKMNSCLRKTHSGT